MGKLVCGGPTPPAGAHNVIGGKPENTVVGEAEAVPIVGARPQALRWFGDMCVSWFL